MHFFAHVRMSECSGYVGHHFVSNLFALIAQESIIASSDTVEDLFYDVVVKSLCDLLLAHLLSLMVLSRSFSRTKVSEGFFLCSHDFSFVPMICPPFLVVVALLA